MVKIGELIGYLLALLLSIIGMVYFIIQCARKVRIKQSRSGNHLNVEIPVPQYDSFE